MSATQDREYLIDLADALDYIFKYHIDSDDEEVYEIFDLLCDIQKYLEKNGSDQIDGQRNQD